MRLVPSDRPLSSSHSQGRQFLRRPHSEAWTSSCTSSPGPAPAAANSTLGRPGVLVPWDSVSAGDPACQGADQGPGARRLRPPARGGPSRTVPAPASPAEPRPLEAGPSAPERSGPWETGHPRLPGGCPVRDRGTLGSFCLGPRVPRLHGLTRAALAPFGGRFRAARVRVPGGREAAPPCLGAVDPAHRSGQRGPGARPLPRASRARVPAMSEGPRPHTS